MSEQEQTTKKRSPYFVVEHDLDSCLGLIDAAIGLNCVDEEKRDVKRLGFSGMYSVLELLQDNVIKLRQKLLDLPTQ